MECALRAYITGVKSTHPNNFIAVEFGPRYWYHLTKLEHLEKNCPTWLVNMKKELYQSIWYVFHLWWFSNVLSRENSDQSGHSILALSMEGEDDGIDYSALEAWAKEAE